MASSRNLILSAALSAVAAVTPANAAATSSGKAEAILGTTSRLAQVLAEQGASGRSLMPSPGSYGISRPHLMPSVAKAPSSEGGYSGKPDVFGSVALSVKQTRLDAQWRRANQSRVGGLAARFAAAQLHKDGASKIDSINRYVNRRVRFVDDQRQYRRADVWASANETLKRGRGDCEDYAIAKLQMLRAAGFSDEDLYLVILKDLVRRSDHAVAVVRSSGRLFVLDNGTDELLDSTQVSDYRPILTFNATGAWTHGYRRPQATLAVASAEPADVAEPISSAPSAAQRSRSASLLALSTGFSR